MTAETLNPEPESDAVEEQIAPACVMSFNASDPTGAGGTAGDVATVAAMGAHALPVVTSIVMRDTAEVFDHHALDADVIAEQARSILEDVTIAAWKVGFLGSAEGVSAVAEILSDYPDVPLVAYMPNLVGSHRTLTDFLLPDWEGDRPASPRELAVAAGEHGTRFVLVTSVLIHSTKTTDQFMDNVLASPEGAITGEKFERFEVSFVGAGDTLSASLAALLAAKR
jgi:hydroxymethylpyrimidine/phosphomethylpyrimidine kinase